MLAASACESARLLLNSKSARFPEGLANSSGVVGKYLHDSTGASRGAIVPALFDRKRYNEDGVGGLHVYSPWWLDNKKLDFPRGYHIEYWGGMGMPAYGFGWGIENTNGMFPDRNGNKREAGGYGASLKDDYRRFTALTSAWPAAAKPLPREDNYCEIDPEKVDKFGIPCCVSLQMVGLRAPASQTHARNFRAGSSMKWAAFRWAINPAADRITA
jgi:hypothetical protein